MLILTAPTSLRDQHGHKGGYILDVLEIQNFVNYCVNGLRVQTVGSLISKLRLDLGFAQRVAWITLWDFHILFQCIAGGGDDLHTGR